MNELTGFDQCIGQDDQERLLTGDGIWLEPYQKKGIIPSLDTILTERTTQPNGEFSEQSKWVLDQGKGAAA